VEVSRVPTDPFLSHQRQALVLKVLRIPHLGALRPLPLLRHILSDHFLEKNTVLVLEDSVELTFEQVSLLDPFERVSLFLDDALVVAGPELVSLEVKLQLKFRASVDHLLHILFYSEVRTKLVDLEVIVD